MSKSKTTTANRPARSARSRRSRSEVAAMIHGCTDLTGRLIFADWLEERQELAKLAGLLLIDQVHQRGKYLHVGRVSSLIRLTFAFEIGADSVDGTFIKFGGEANLARIAGWYERLEEALQKASTHEDHPLFRLLPAI